jgi:glycosyltransferase involved in cell wall biosynthesis
MDVEPQSSASVLVAQIGARRHYAVPRALAAAGLLERLHTDIAFPLMLFGLSEQNAKILPASLKRLLGRQATGIPGARLSTSPLFAFSALWDRRQGEPDPDRWSRRNARFGELVVEQGFGAANAVYAFNGAALEIFAAARDQGLATILDQTAAPLRWNRRMLAEEMEKWQGWEDAPGDLDTSGLLMEREEEEWTMADKVVCGSPFVRDTLASCEGTAPRCEVVPYPAAATWVSQTQLKERGTADQKVRVLFVGTLQLRKGVQYLAEALRQLPRANLEVRLVGPMRLGDRAMRELASHCEIVGPKPRSEMAKEYEWADLFVLPTLSEGSANVCHEAMSAGLPVITTPNAGSTVEHEKSGLIVHAGDAAALAEAIERLSSDANLRYVLGQGAVQRAAPAGLNDYGSALAEVIAEALLSRKYASKAAISA